MKSTTRRACFAAMALLSALGSAQAAILMPVKLDPAQATTVAAGAARAAAGGSAVPEVSTCLMLVAGLVLIGISVLRRRDKR